MKSPFEDEEIEDLMALRKLIMLAPLLLKMKTEKVSREEMLKEYKEASK
jgi:hypothetical protein